MAERLMFLNEDRNLNIKIIPRKQKYLPREKVELTVKTMDRDGKPIPSNLSLAVIDDKLWSFADNKQDHILSWLLLNSELKGKVDEPQFYFKADEPKAIPALDLVMLTNGYRYFDYNEYVTKTGNLQYNVEQENMLSGVIVDAKNNPLQSTVYLVNVADQSKAVPFKTRADGLFFFSDLEPGKDYYVFAQGPDKKEQVVINILQNGVGYNPLEKATEMRQLELRKHKFLAAEEMRFDAVARKEIAIPAAVVKAEPAKPMEFENSQLNEVVVVGFNANRKRDLTAAVALVRADELAATRDITNVLAGKVPGITVTASANDFANPGITVRGAATMNTNSQALVIVDGIPVASSELKSFNTNEIDNITVLKSNAAAALYGCLANQGAIIIVTKKFRNERISFKTSNQYAYSSKTIIAAGKNFDPVRRFYVPAYTSVETNERTDFRETIYWNPTVQTDKNGEAVVSFYNSDASTTFRAIAEGIGYNGLAGIAETTYYARQALTTDIKIPPYLTVGDKALLPVVMKNNTEAPLIVTVGIDLPKNIRVGQFQNKLELQADSSMQLLIPIEATDVTSGHIHLTINNGKTTETIIQPIRVNAKGFPVIATIAGNNPAQHNFDIGKMIPGTLTANLKLFKNPEGQLLDGIESMLREPGGCFEQTSSSLYPNVFVLKFLRAAKKSNPEVEAKAMGYIKNGYKRLLGFETAQAGFEWFGNTPPHEALTAYGLLEFTDMKEFIDVDASMLARTKKFLLDRRDGKGGFKLMSGGYDQFRAVPDKIANIYIVYALTQAGIGKEIISEYNNAVSKAIDSNDGYLLSMMALAASNMHNQNDFAMLIEKARASYTKSRLQSETSVVNSRESSLRVETMALYALAMMREAQPPLVQVAEVISAILAEKTYYGYGATQATVLALNAIVEYSKLVGQANENPLASFMINNVKVAANNPLTEGIHEGRNHLDVQFDNAKKQIPYCLEVAYQTFTPPNSEKAELHITTTITNRNPRVGETTRMNISVTNKKGELQAMSIAKIGIPAGLALQPWQLKEIIEKKKAAYYEIFDNYLVIYWMGFKGNESKTISLDLKAEIPGTYKAKSSNMYLYYMPEHKHWAEGIEVGIRE